MADIEIGAGITIGGGVTLGGSGGGGGGTTYNEGSDYSSAGFNGMGTSGYLIVQGMDGAMTTAFSNLIIGSVIVALYNTGSNTANLTLTGAPTYQGPTPGDWYVSVTSDVPLVGTSFNSLQF